MGQELSKIEFNSADEASFKERLREETKYLKNLFDSRQFEYSEEQNLGLELEAWLVDEDFLPAPQNDQFLEKLNDPMVVHELSQFNFELNTDPVKVGHSGFSVMKEKIECTWKHCHQTAGSMGLKPLLVGILPMVREDMLDLRFVSNSNRYIALNKRLFALREGAPLQIHIKGREELKLSQDHLMMESAATSLQIHLQCNQENAVRIYNAAQIVSAPLLAVSANSPYLYGVDLWDETRIAVFEQAVNVKSFRDKRGVDIGRVTFGTGYAKKSFLEPFIENLDAYPPLLPLIEDKPTDQMSHLKLHNGWNSFGRAVDFTLGWLFTPVTIYPALAAKMSRVRESLRFGTSRNLRYPQRVRQNDDTLLWAYPKWLGLKRQHRTLSLFRL